MIKMIKKKERERRSPLAITLFLFDCASTILKIVGQISRSDNKRRLVAGIAPLAIPIQSIRIYITQTPSQQVATARLIPHLRWWHCITSNTGAFPKDVGYVKLHNSSIGTFFTSKRQVVALSDERTPHSGLYGEDVRLSLFFKYFGVPVAENDIDMTCSWHESTSRAVKTVSPFHLQDTTV